MSVNLLCPHCHLPGLKWDQGDALYDCPHCSAQVEDHEVPKVTTHPNGLKVMEMDASTKGREYNMNEVAWRRPFIYYPQDKTVSLGRPGDTHGGIIAPGKGRYEGHMGYVSLGESEHGAGFFGTNIPPEGMGWFDDAADRSSGNIPAYHHHVQQALKAVEPKAAQTHTNLPTEQDEEEWTDGDSYPGATTIDPPQRDKTKYVLGSWEDHKPRPMPLDWRPDIGVVRIKTQSYAKSFRTALDQLNPVEVVDARMDPMQEAINQKYRNNDFAKRIPVIYDGKSKVYVGGPRYYHGELSFQHPEIPRISEGAHHGYVWTHRNTMDWYHKPDNHEDIMKAVGEHLKKPLTPTVPTAYEEEDFWDHDE